MRSPAPETRPQTGQKAYAHATDYTWLVGELQYYHGRKVWRIRYAPIDVEDRYGGSVTLMETGTVSMSKFESGQIIRIEGRLRDPEAREPSPAFVVKSIQILQ